MDFGAEGAAARRPTEESLAAIRDSVERAATAFGNMISAYDPRASEYRDEQEEIVCYFLDTAFLELRLFLEARGLLLILRSVSADHRNASKDWMKSAKSTWGDPYSFWSSRLNQYLRAVETTLGSASSSTITKDLTEILRATVYSITDRKCFAAPPSNEHEVHVRIEAVLRCVFPDLRTRPPIGKSIKNFQPDTGLPSIRTLIEYKFVSSDDEVARIADEALADSRGYVSRDWERSLYAIYETKRLRPEHQWRELLRSSHVGEGGADYSDSGEPIVSPRNGRAKPSGSRKKTRGLRNGLDSPLPG